MALISIYIIAMAFAVISIIKTIKNIKNQPIPEHLKNGK
jgi:uncharacterized protein YoxC